MMSYASYYNICITLNLPFVYINSATNKQKQACWTILQCEWMTIQYKQSSKDMEHILHFILPFSFSTIMTFMILQLYHTHNNYNYNHYYKYDFHHHHHHHHTQQQYDWDVIWTIIPFTFTACLSWSMKLICN